MNTGKYQITTVNFLILGRCTLYSKDPSMLYNRFFNAIK